MDYTTIQNAATKIVDNIKVIDGNISALQNKQDIISTSDMSMMNSHDGKLKIEEIGGKCEQVSTSGKNLLDNVVNPGLRNGISITKNSDKSLTLSGTATDLTFLELDRKTFAPDKKYFLSGGLSTNVLLSIRLASDYGVTYVTDAGNGAIYSPTEETEVAIVVRIENGATVNNTVYPMLNEGDTPLPWEPYTGGQPSPNPDYPQEIKKTVVSEIKTHGKNLLNCIEALKKTENGITFTPVYNEDGKLQYVELNGTSTAEATLRLNSNVNLDISEKYILSDSTSTSVAKYYTQLYNSDGLYLPNSVDNDTFVPRDVTYIARILVTSGVTLDHVRFYPMIRKADVEDDTYEPYTESTIILSQPVELYGIGDVRNTIVRKDGVLGVEKNYAIAVLDGTKNISRAPQERDTTTYRFYISDAYIEAQIKRYASNERPYILSDTLNPETVDRVYWSVEGISVASSGMFMVYHEKFKNYTVDQMKEFLSNASINVIYRLASPIFEPLPAVDQIALNSLSTYDTVTYLEFDSEIEPTFKGEYGVTKMGGHVLEDMMTGLNSELLAQSDADRIAALESTIVNNIQD